jgi:hypothetical protein
MRKRNEHKLQESLRPPLERDIIWKKYMNRKNIGIEMVCFCNPMGIEMRRHLVAS